MESALQRHQVHAQGRQGAGASRADQFAPRNCRRRQWPGDRQATRSKTSSTGSGRLPTHGSGDRGMGLGLSIVKHIVNLHGGTVTAHSDGLGKGSVFAIRLPLPVTTAGLASPARRHPTATAVAQSAPVPRLERISALVVDDDPETREALKSLLTSLGASVSDGGNGRQCDRRSR